MKKAYIMPNVSVFYIVEDVLSTSNGGGALDLGYGDRGAFDDGTW